MRRQQILKFRAAGLFPPVSAHERERWEHDYGADVRAFTREHPIDINGPPPNERILTDWADWRQARAKAQELAAAIDAQTETVMSEHAQEFLPAIDLDAPAAAVWPLASDRTCPHCGKVTKHPQALKWHLRGCPERPRTAA